LAQQLHLGLGRLIVEVSSSHSIRHKHTHTHHRQKSSEQVTTSS